MRLFVSCVPIIFIGVPLILGSLLDIDNINIFFTICMIVYVWCTFNNIIIAIILSQTNPWASIECSYEWYVLCKNLIIELIYFPTCAQYIPPNLKGNNGIHRHRACTACNSCFYNICTFKFCCKCSVVLSILSEFNAKGFEAAKCMASCLPNKSTFSLLF